MPEQKTGPDQRQQVRVPIELKVDYKKLNSFFADYTKNISKGGTFIKTKKPLPIGTRFLFKLTVPQREAPFELLGEVVWSQGDAEEPGMGIRFIYKSAEERRHVEHLVERLMVDSLGQLVTHKLMTQGGDRGNDDDGGAGT